MVFISPVMKQNPPRNARHVPIVEGEEEDEVFPGVFSEEIDDSFLDKPYTQPEQDETDEDELKEGPTEREMATELEKLVKGPQLKDPAQVQADPVQADPVQADQVQADQVQADPVQRPEAEGPKDQYPVMAKVEPGVYRLPGRTVPFYITPNLNHCGACGQRSKKTWCSHLISAGIKEGYNFLGKEYLP